MTRPLYTGWLKPKGGPWRRVCEAATWDDCWALTLAAPMKGDGERLVNDGKHPDRRKRPR